jgi:hypothetical protein
MITLSARLFHFAHHYILPRSSVASDGCRQRIQKSAQNLGPHMYSGLGMESFAALNASMLSKIYCYRMSLSEMTLRIS